VFPSKKLSSVAQSDHIGRRHADATGLHKAVKRAITAAGLTKLTSCRTFRPFDFAQDRLRFAAHLPEAGYNIRIVQELLGHKDVQSTLIYTHVLNRGRMAVRSPLD
jgi:site-specific recombinase XerD